VVADAAEKADWSKVRALLKEHTDANAVQKDGMTALHWAAFHDNLETASALLAAGAKPKVENRFGVAPLSLACTNGNADLVKTLLAAGADPNATLHGGETALMTAARTGSVEAAKVLLTHGAAVDSRESWHGQTALMWAAAEGHGDVVAGLVTMGANVNAASRTGFTPLVFAVIKDDLASIKTLLGAGANPNVALLSGATPIVVAMQYRHTAATLLLIEGGADINKRDRGGNTMLHLAAQTGDMQLVRVLLAKGSDPNARTPTSKAPSGARGGGGLARGGTAGEQTPLMMAARSDHEDVMRALVAAGADPGLRAQDGASLLMAAASGARLKTFTYAFELDPNVDTVTTTGNTVMHVAVGMNGRTQPEVCEVIQFLADHGAALDEMNGAGRTPIAIADGLPVDLAVDLLTKLITERGGKPRIPSKR
jgi:ankyrin repeat protein